MENGRLAVSFFVNVHGYAAGATTVRVYVGMDDPPGIVLTDSINVNTQFFPTFDNSGVGAYRCMVTVDNAIGHDEFGATFDLL